jgi:hypothetical protein
MRGIDGGNGGAFMLDKAAVISTVEQYAEIVKKRAFALCHCFSAPGKRRAA